MEKKNDHIGILMRQRSDTLAHHGIKGQKWYKRRFQNDDGSLTAAGRKRYGVGDGDDDGKEESKKAGGDAQDASKRRIDTKVDMDGGATRQKYRDIMISKTFQESIPTNGEYKPRDPAIANLGDSDPAKVTAGADAVANKIEPGSRSNVEGIGKGGDKVSPSGRKFRDIQSDNQDRPKEPGYHGVGSLEYRRRMMDRATGDSDAQIRRQNLANGYSGDSFRYKLSGELAPDAPGRTPSSATFGKKKADPTETETPKPEASTGLVPAKRNTPAAPKRDTGGTDDDTPAALPAAPRRDTPALSAPKKDASRKSNFDLEDKVDAENRSGGPGTTRDKTFTFGKKKTDDSDNDGDSRELPAAPKRDTPAALPAAPKRDTGGTDDDTPAPRAKTFTFGKNKDGDEDGGNPYRDRFGKTDQDDDYRSSNKPVTFGKKSDDDDSDSTPKTFSFGKNKDGDEDDGNPYRDRSGKTNQDDDYRSGNKPITFGKKSDDDDSDSTPKTFSFGKNKDGAEDDGNPYRDRFGKIKQDDDYSSGNKPFTFGKKGDEDASEPTGKPVTFGKKKNGDEESGTETTAPKGNGKGKGKDGTEKSEPPDPKKNGKGSTDNGGDNSNTGKSKEKNTEAEPKKEFNFDKASKVANAGAKLADTLKKQSDERIKNAPKVKLDLSNMTNAELRAAIDRGALEKAYHDYYAPSSVSKGEVTFNKMLGTISAVLAIGGSALSLAGAIKGFLK